MHSACMMYRMVIQVSTFHKHFLCLILSITVNSYLFSSYCIPSELCDDCLNVTTTCQTIETQLIDSQARSRMLFVYLIAQIYITFDLISAISLISVCFLCYSMFFNNHRSGQRLQFILINTHCLNTFYLLLRCWCVGGWGSPWLSFVLAVWMGGPLLCCRGGDGGSVRWSARCCWLIYITECEYGTLIFK